MEVPHAIEADGQLVCIEDARPPNVPANVREHLRETRNDDGDRAPTMASTKGCSRQPSRDSKRRRRQSECDGERATRRWGDKAASPEIENVFFVWLLGHRCPNPHIHQAAEQAPPSQGGPAVEKASDMANNLRRTLLATVTSRCDGGREDPRPSPCLVLWGHAQRHRDEAKTLREMTTNSHEHSIPLGRTTNTSQDDPYQIRRTTVS